MVRRPRRDSSIRYELSAGFTGYDGPGDEGEIWLTAAGVWLGATGDLDGNGDPIFNWSCLGIRLQQIDYMDGPNVAGIQTEARAFRIKKTKVKGAKDALTSTYEDLGQIGLMDVIDLGGSGAGVAYPFGQNNWQRLFIDVSQKSDTVKFGVYSIRDMRSYVLTSNVFADNDYAAGLEYGFAFKNNKSDGGSMTGFVSELTVRVKENYTEWSGPAGTDGNTGSYKQYAANPLITEIY